MDSLRIGLSGILSSQSLISLYSSNVANADSEGYTRRTGNTAAGIPVPGYGGFTGSGANAYESTKRIDAFSLKSLFSASANESFYSASVSSASSFESVVDSGTSSLSTAWTSISDAMKSAVISPSTTTFAGIEAAFSKFTSTSSTLVSNLDWEISSMKGSVYSGIEHLNTLSSSLASINSSIVTAGNNAPSSLLDMRDSVAKEIASLSGSGIHIEDNGTASMTKDGAMLVFGTKSYDVSVSENFANSGTLSFSSTVSFNMGGSLGGTASVISKSTGIMDGIAVYARNALESLSADWTTGTDSSGNPVAFPLSPSKTSTSAFFSNSGTANISLSGAALSGTLVYSGGTWNIEDKSGTSPIPATSSVVIESGAPSEGDRFSIANSASFPLSFDFSAIPSGASPFAGKNDTSNLTAMSVSMNEFSFSEKIASLNSSFASFVSQETSLSETSSAVLSNIKGSLDRFSVNLDEEAANIALQQQIYAASSKTVSIAQSLFATFLDAIG